MTNYTHFLHNTPQTERAKPNQVRGRAGGYVFGVDHWERLNRFLVLGSESPTYYASQRELVVGNYNALQECLRDDPLRVVQTILEISEGGRAPKQSPTLFALAVCAAHSVASGPALSVLPRVARTGTHLFQFLGYVQQFRGWGRALRDAVSDWYNGKNPDALAYQVLKYRQRNGWTHRDALRKAHPVPVSDAHNDLYNWITQGEYGGKIPSQVIAYEAAQVASGKDLLNLIADYRLTWEMLPTEALNDPDVWAAMLPNMPVTALVRNLGKMSSIGLLSQFSDNERYVIGVLSEEDRVANSRIHPLQVLVASMVYGQGHGVRGSLSWDVNQRIVDALEDAFYISFGNVEATGKRHMLALDVSGSMGWGAIAGMEPITPRVGSAAMAMVTARTEPDSMFMAFAHEFRPLSITARTRLDDAVDTVAHLPFGGTDCSLPMRYALQNRIPVDVFVVYTDSETWAGRHQHPFQALESYRQGMGIPARMIVVGMTSDGFSIADPDDWGSLDVVGFDTAAPNLMADFVRD